MEEEKAENSGNNLPMGLTMMLIRRGVAISCLNLMFDVCRLSPPCLDAQHMLGWFVGIMSAIKVDWHDELYFLFGSLYSLASLLGGVIFKELLRDL